MEVLGAHLRIPLRILAGLLRVRGYVSFHQPRLIMSLLICKGTNWDIEAETLVHREVLSDILVSSVSLEFNKSRSRYSIIYI